MASYYPQKIRMECKKSEFSKLQILIFPRKFQKKAEVFSRICFFRQTKTYLHHRLLLEGDCHRSDQIVHLAEKIDNLFLIETNSRRRVRDGT